MSDSLNLEGISQASLTNSNHPQDSAATTEAEQDGLRDAQTAPKLRHPEPLKRPREGTSQQRHMASNKTRFLHRATGRYYTYSDDGLYFVFEDNGQKVPVPRALIPPTAGTSRSALVESHCTSRLES